MNWKALRTPAFLLTLSVLVFSSLGMGAAIAKYKLMLRKLPIYPPNGVLLSSMPERAGQWIKYGPDQIEHGEVLESLGTTNYLTRAYGKLKPGKTGAGGTDDIDQSTIIEFHTAYYTGMIDTVPHVPDRCFVAGGMQLAGLTKDIPLELDRHRWRADEYAPPEMAGRLYTMFAKDRTSKHLPLDPQNLKLHCTKYVTEGSAPLHAGYFFIANGGAVARAEEVRLLAFDLHSRYAYYLKVQFTSSRVTSEGELAALAASFLDETFGDLMKCVPDWVDVEAGDYPPDNPARKN